MVDRCLAPLGLIAVVATISLLAPVHAAGQGASGSRDNWTTPRTSWGDPDLEGVWTTDWERSVPFERPTEFGERPELTPEEVAERAESESLSLVDSKETRKPRPGDPEAGPEHWYEFGKQTSARTSLVVDPSDGRVPPMTLGAQTRQVDPSTRLGFVGGSMGDGPFDGPKDLHLADRCITRGYLRPGSQAPTTTASRSYRAPVTWQWSTSVCMNIASSRSTGAHSWRPVSASGSAIPVATGTAIHSLLKSPTSATRQLSGRRIDTRLIERYTRVDADTVRVEITNDDPMTWTEP